MQDVPRVRRCGDPDIQLRDWSRHNVRYEPLKVCEVKMDFAADDCGIRHNQGRCIDSRSLGIERAKRSEKSAGIVIGARVDILLQIV